eukprot:750542-Hanusia_phi.AAC.2
MSVLLALLSYPFGSQMKVGEEEEEDLLLKLVSQAITMGVMGLGMVMRDGLLFVGSMLFVLLSFGRFSCLLSSCSQLAGRQVATCQIALTCWADELVQLGGSGRLLDGKPAACWAISCKVVVEQEKKTLLLSIARLFSSLLTSLVLSRVPFFSRHLLHLPHDIFSSLPLAFSPRSTLFVLLLHLSRWHLLAGRKLVVVGSQRVRVAQLERRHCSLVFADQPASLRQSCPFSPRNHRSWRKSIVRLKR